MKSKIYNLSINLNRIDSRHAKVVLTIVSLALFALGAGAPGVYSGP